MDMTSPVRRSPRLRKDSSLGQCLPEKGSELQSKVNGKEAEDREAESMQYVPSSGYGSKETVSDKDCGKCEAENKKLCSSLMKKKAPKNPKRRTYGLRTSENYKRVLRSNTIIKAAPIPQPCAPSSVIPVREKKKRRKKPKSVPGDEYALIRKSIIYSLKRINCEQNLLDAYCSEGWRGQSLEKIRPEKELDRAKYEILRCKLKIRELFRHLSSLLSDGRLEESLFDSEGEISSEDIFCAKCRSKNLSVDNDIILCDGICDRGFHQHCLNPPLLNDDIPPGDEGWLCPGCDCKDYSIDLLNEYQGINLKIEDAWEKIFPEALAIVDGDQQCVGSGLPSDDSNDDDYKPDNLDSDAHDKKEGSSSEEAGFTSSSEDIGNLKNNNIDEYFGFPSEDSEDDDYVPNKKEPDEKIPEGESSFNKSDFTSDSDEFCAEICRSSFANDSSASSMPELKTHGKERNIKGENEQDINPDNILPVSSKRQREHLDYKKLYEEAWRDASSDSSDDEDWSKTSKTKKRKKEATGEGSHLPIEYARLIWEFGTSRKKKMLVEENTHSRPNSTKDGDLIKAHDECPERLYPDNKKDATSRKNCMKVNFKKPLSYSNEESSAKGTKAIEATTPDEESTKGASNVAVLSLDEGSGFSGSVKDSTQKSGAGTGRRKKLCRGTSSKAKPRRPITK